MTTVRASQPPGIRAVRARIYDAAAHHSLACRVAATRMVLLRNDGISCGLAAVGNELLTDLRPVIADVPATMSAKVCD